jgi:hypothetical protein
MQKLHMLQTSARLLVVAQFIRLRSSSSRRLRLVTKSDLMSGLFVGNLRQLGRPLAGRIHDGILSAT